MKKKRCPRCGRTLSISAFNKNKANRDGVQSVCRKCQRKYDRKFYRDNPGRLTEIRNRSKIACKRNKKYVLDFLRDHYCVDCGETDVIVLDFDHVRGQKKGCIANLVKDVSIKTLQQEIDKCEVVCANCHRRRTAKRANWV